MTDTIIDLGKGKFGYQSVEPDSREPIMRTWVWPLVNCRIEGMGGNDLKDSHRPRGNVPQRARELLSRKRLLFPRGDAGIGVDKGDLDYRGADTAPAHQMVSPVCSRPMGETFSA